MKRTRDERVADGDGNIAAGPPQRKRKVRIGTTEYSGEVSCLETTLTNESNFYRQLPTPPTSFSVTNSTNCPKAKKCEGNPMSNGDASYPCVWDKSSEEHGQSSACPIISSINRKPLHASGLIPAVESNGVSRSQPAIVPTSSGKNGMLSTDDFTNSQIASGCTLVPDKSHNARSEDSISRTSCNAATGLVETKVPVPQSLSGSKSNAFLEAPVDAVSDEGVCSEEGASTETNFGQSPQVLPKSQGHPQVSSIQKSASENEKNTEISDPSDRNAQNTASRYLPGALLCMIQCAQREQSSDESVERLFFTGCNVAVMDKAFKCVSIIGFVIWLSLLAVVYKVTPERFWTKLEPAESYSAIFGSALIIGSLLTKLTTLCNQLGRKRVWSGCILGSLAVQFIAACTNLLMACGSVPIILDPVTGARTYPFRYCEWTTLAFMMTFFTEGADVPIDTEYVNGPRRRNLQQLWKVVSGPVLLGTCEGLSALCGLIFPYCPDFFWWMFWMIFSCVTFLVLFPHLGYKMKQFSMMSRGSSVEEVEAYDRKRLSVRLLTCCVIMWTLLVSNYYFASFAAWFGAESSILAHKSLPFISDVVIDVMAKAMYMDVIVEIHSCIFDDVARATRRLEELRKMMSVVWDCSSDVIAISVKGENDTVTTMLSPSFHNIECIGSDAKGFATKKKNPIVFEMKSSDFSAFISEEKSDKHFSCLTCSTASKHDLFPKAVYYADINDEGCICVQDNGINAQTHPSLVSMCSVIAHAWIGRGVEQLLVHDVEVRSGDPIQCEAKATKMGPHVLVVVMRDISERFMCFEAEKRAVTESIARKKDAEANRFTRHEVKNGLLAAIGLCDGLRETITDAPGATDQAASSAKVERGPKNGRSKIKKSRTHADGSKVESTSRCVVDLDSTLRDILDTVLAEAMARDVIHEVYEPKMERVDVEQVLSSIVNCQERFPLATNPSPLPVFLFDPQLLKYIYRNAVSNACKYGKRGGVVVTDVHFENDINELRINVINQPGENHEVLVALGEGASQAVFAAGKRLHEREKFGESSEARHSSGDGAWISRKCARTLGGDCSISFEKDRTVFSLRCEARPYNVVLKLFPDLVGDPSNFRLPADTWGIAIDDSKIQRKLMHRFFTVAGIPPDKQVLLGEDAEEIRGFIDHADRLIKNWPESYFLVIADENLDVVERSGDYHTISGSLCLQKLRHQLGSKHEQRMLALVRSANDSASDIAIYNSRAHGFVCKAPIQREKIMEILAPIWARRFAKYFPVHAACGVPSSVKGDDSSTASASKNIRHVTSQLRFETDDNVSTAVSLMLTVEVIDALCTSDDSLLEIRWQVLSEKLLSLRSDLSKVEHSDVVSKLLESVDSLRQPTPPRAFFSDWASLRSQIIRVI